MNETMSLTALRMAQIQQQYSHQLLEGTVFSIADFLNFGNFRLDEYCKQLYPHPQSGEIIRIAQQYCEEHGIWCDNAKHYITCELYLYPDAQFDRMLAMVENNAIDYYLNDVVGRDLFGHLKATEQLEARNLMKRMASVDHHLLLPADATPVEKANVEILQFMKETSPAVWFEEFMQLYCYHIDVTHRDGNSDALGHIPTVEEYIDLRCHTSGMHHIVLLIEYAEGNFLSKEWCAAAGIDDYLRRVNFLTAAFGCLSNDLFSFEKEVIDNSTDANLLMAVALNHPAYTFNEVIGSAAKIVQDILIELLDLIDKINGQLSKASAADADKTARLNKHLKGIDKCVQASWLWQVYTKRYKRPASIWLETQLPDPIAKAV
ncbi:terpene synthase family protein [Chitinophaga sp. RAB17]|uniref:terpene synthase family protein n=1 Tax=Chitinophaga sp. RAB17 TaxID=3233049 RepID=UPI003F902252